MIDKELTGKYTDEEIQQIGLWLDQYMPNPPLSLKQRWSVGHHWIQNDEFSFGRWAYSLLMIEMLHYSHYAGKNNSPG